MKRKYLAIILGMMIGISSLYGCSGNTEENTTETTEEAELERTQGQVTAISDASITIEVFEMKEPGENANTEEAAEESTEAETLEIAITEETVINRQTMQGMGGGKGGQMPGGGAGGEMGEMPEMPTDGEMPEMPEGGEMPEMPADGEMPEMPTDGEMPEMPTEGGDIQEMPQGDTTGESGEAPEKPEGGEMNGEAPEKPEGDGTDGEMTEMPTQEAEAIALSDITVGDMVMITLNADGSAAEITVMSMGAGGGQSNAPSNYEAVNEYDADTEVSGETVISEGTDENAILITNGASVTMDDVMVTRKSADSTGGDNSSFYGIGAAVLTTDGTSYISNSAIDTDASGGAGIFSYGEGTTYVADTEITTQQDTSGGIHAAGGGTLYAWDLTVETNGESAAAIRSDRGGGTMVVDGGYYVSNGVSSPVIYSTAEIAVNNATLSATGSEAICIEGRNSIHLFDCDLTGNMQQDDRNDCIWNVTLYQSMSGDSEEGNSIFEMNGGTLTAQNGGMFYTTNTESTITLSNVAITNAEDNAFFLQCTGNNNQRGWGTAGDNGADCLFTGIAQEMEGDIIWDSISTLDFYMTERSSLIGAVVNDETYALNGGNGYCKLYIDEGCTWTVTGDSTLSEVYSEGKIVDGSGNTVTIKGTDGTVYVEGSSGFVVTVDAYYDEVDMSGKSDVTFWEDYQVEKPENLG